MQLHGALINGLETRVSEIESQLSDLDARGSEDKIVKINQKFGARNGEANLQPLVFKDGDLNIF